jgi:hypothetical protein
VKVSGALSRRGFGDRGLNLAANVSARLAVGYFLQLLQGADLIEPKSRIPLGQRGGSFQLVAGIIEGSFSGERDAEGKMGSWVVLTELDRRSCFSDRFVDTIRS